MLKIREDWKDIEGFEDYTIDEKGNIYSKRKRKYLKQTINKFGYCQVTLQKDKYKKMFSVHRLVAQAFIPNPKNKPQVNHIDSNRQNNNVKNLEWVTAKENKKHALDNNLLKPRKCEENGRTAYTNDMINDVCRLLEESNLTIKEISEKTNVGVDTIYGIRSKNIWNDISKNYKIHKDLIPPSVYKKEQIILVCELLEKGYSQTDIQKKTGVKLTTISNIKNKKRWVSVSKKYKI